MPHHICTLSLFSGSVPLSSQGCRFQVPTRNSHIAIHLPGSSSPSCPTNCLPSILSLIPIKTTCCVVTTGRETAFRFLYSFSPFPTSVLIGSESQSLADLPTTPFPRPPHPRPKASFVRDAFVVPEGSIPSLGSRVSLCHWAVLTAERRDRSQ